MDVCKRGLNEMLAKCKGTSGAIADFSVRSVEITEFLSEVEAETIPGKMAETKGKANARQVNEILHSRLDE